MSRDNSAARERPLGLQREDVYADVAGHPGCEAHGPSLAAAEPARIPRMQEGIRPPSTGA